MIKRVDIPFRPVSQGFKDLNQNENTRSANFYHLFYVRREQRIFLDIFEDPERKNPSTFVLLSFYQKRIILYCTVQQPVTCHVAA
jgi:hypothetical protein